MNTSCTPPYITVTRGMSGWFAVLLAYYDDIKGYDIYCTGIGRYEDKADAEAEARQWAAAENIESR